MPAVAIDDGSYLLDRQADGRDMSSNIIPLDLQERVHRDLLSGRPSHPMASNSHYDLTVHHLLHLSRAQRPSS